jgi:hypothetical protein
MPYITNQFNRKQMYRSPDRDYKKKTYAFYSILFLFIITDIYASKAVQINPHHLDIIVAVLYPVSWIFSELGVPITGGFLDGPQPSVYYHVLMLNSALLGVIWGGLLTYDYCKRCRFFRYPAYGAKLAQRNALRHPTAKVFANARLYWFFLRTMYLSLIVISIVTIWHVYPGRVTFHTSGFVMPIYISIMVAVVCCFSPSSFFGLISCICSDIDTIRKR